MHVPERLEGFVEDPVDRRRAVAIPDLHMHFEHDLVVDVGGDRLVLVSFTGDDFGSR